MSPQARVNDKEGTENYEQTVSTSGGDSQQVGEDETPVSPRDSDSNQASIEPREPSTEKFVYRDFSSRETDRAGRSSSPNSTIRVQKLPAKLNAMLSNPNFSHIISWMPHGRAWKVHNAHAFVEEVVPRYFEYTNYNSFIRLVNAWGFRRLLKGPDRNSYYHELFLRGMPHLHARMHRLTPREKKAPVDPDNEPDFYRMGEATNFKLGNPSETGAETELALLRSLGGISAPVVMNPLLLGHAASGLLPPSYRQMSIRNRIASLSDPTGSRFAGDFLSPAPLLHQGGGSAGLGLHMVSERLRAPPVSNLASESAEAALGISSSPALSGMTGALHRQKAALSATRHRLELELDRIREQERLLNLAILRSTNNTYRHRPFPAPGPSSSLDAAHALNASVVESLALQQQRASTPTSTPSSHQTRASRENDSTTDQREEV